MRAVIAIDSFKGSLSSIEAGWAAGEGIKRVYPDAEIEICPLADGGEGTVSAVVSALGGELVSIEVTGPLGSPVMAEYGMISERRLAVMEMSAAAGITLVEESKRNPMNTTTYGVGEMIADAISKGCRKFIMGIGGSATNDGGVGMLQALGFEFLDKDGKEIARCGGGLEFLAEIKTSKANKALAECEFLVACDVKNPLCGERGCSAIYGPQKGATPDMIEKMDGWLLRYAELTKKINPEADKDFWGAGAAGGMGFAFLSYLGGRLESGIELVIRETGIEEKIKSADVVVTGEGRLDGQSAMGKAPVGIARVAKKYGKPVIAFSGIIGDGAEACNADECGIDAFFPIVRRITTLDEAMNVENASQNLADTAEQVFRLMKTFK
jgi:glycerate kinase